MSRGIYRQHTRRDKGYQAYGGSLMNDAIFVDNMITILIQILSKSNLSSSLERLFKMPKNSTSWL